jgi:uncharacterized protein (DUF2267 family)
MSDTGLDVFDKTVQTTNLWLDEITDELGPDRRLAWHALGTVLRAVRDRVPADLAAHFAAELPLLIRGVYYDQYRPSRQPERIRNRNEFVERIGEDFAGTRPVNVDNAIRAVLATVSRHVPAGEVENVRGSLPEELRALWPTPDEARAMAHEDTLH